MPLYEYECTACHKRTEKIQKFSDPEITTCPHCGGHIERVLSAPAIAFKGGGWFADGYGNAKPKSSGDSASNGNGASGAEAKSNGGDSKSSSDSKSGSSETKSGGDSKSGSSETKSSNTTSASNGSTSAPAAAPAKASSSSDKK